MTTRVLHIGQRFSRVDKPEGKVVRVHDKLERRIERRRAMTEKSRIEVELAKCRHEDNQVRRLATNSHEAQRYVAASRSER